jgi:hypothetical protein
VVGGVVLVGVVGVVVVGVGVGEVPVVGGGVGVVGVPPFGAGGGLCRRWPSRMMITWAGMALSGMCVAQAAIMVIAARDAHSSGDPQGCGDPSVVAGKVGRVELDRVGPSSLDGRDCKAVLAVRERRAR